MQCQEVAAQAHKLSIMSTESMLHERHACNCRYGPTDSRLLTPTICVRVSLQPGCHAAQLLVLLLLRWVDSRSIVTVRVM